MSEVREGAFARYVGARLGGLPGVRAVTLGGSRADGRQRDDSDWDFSLYYRGAFEPERIRDLGWAGEVFPIGGWGGGVFNGGAWLTVDGRRVDVHYRDLDDVERHLAEAAAGWFRVEPLAFHLVGVPTYIVVAELATRRLLAGSLPSVDEYPRALRAAAPPRWLEQASTTLGYARAAHALRGHLSDTGGAIAVALACAAHAVLAARGEWITNDKHLIDRAGLRPADAALAGLTADPASLARAIDRAEAFINAAVAGIPAARPRRTRDDRASNSASIEDEG
ncbi:MAG TPA: nucleotidyltransferase domain-containing protein [Trebonia sp.]|jgi:predicted nucleotidyltransferase|nr:nucleotidyltransferase domain-containing protein [Trebonia sp.]